MRLGNTVEFTHVALGLVPEILNAIDVIVAVCEELRKATLFCGSIRFSTAAFRSGEYPTSLSYPAHLKNREK